MEEFALIIFTICVQAAVGLMVFTAVAKQLNKTGVFKIAVAASAGLAVVGLLASFLHLGHPLAAVNTLTRFATSWLSREIWFTSAFTGLTVFAVLLLYFKPAAKKALNTLIILAAAIGLIDVLAMASVYTSSSVAAWQSGSIVVEFYAAAISMGALLFLALSAKEDTGRMRKIVAISVAAAFVIQAVVMLPYYNSFGGSDNLALQQSHAILSSMTPAMVLKWAAILVGAGLLFLPAKEKSKEVPIILGATALVLLGQIVGRYLFFAIMIVS
ncbi:dimethyl sulfoxide reductase anchor subunit family protein [Desulfitobacterium chlororespirans]|uniref:Anaerobic dimethyl sulfoxide reductase subunit C (DMSO reductase anchor subunit) n=1 Tax=Desulfitobacterium chlororespirans DSM 11544 TaxID=1121395 RepID=A0A1M7TYR3_9FIRM|nr:DmsC/YnfH family molybdoenzyme membrane anchor subunit [Desulfitobacterium chlororespirans]SHN75848.1 anaerobic dimethyl sulfoxide reductase subunit C (DMSO reductase anchor subunit) [Desulfitobacterium chlororespirans DSM 11544]